MPLQDFSKEFISTCIAEQDAYAHLCSMCDSIGPRLPATSGEAKAVRQFVSHMDGLGFETATQEFRYDAWQFGSSQVRFNDGTGRKTVPSNPMGWSPGTSVTAPLVDSGYCLESDLKHIDARGKVLLVSNGVGPGQKGVHRSVKYASAAEAGAAGFLFHPGRPGGQVPMGSITLDDSPGSIPAAGICYEDAMALRRMEHVEVELSTDCKVEDSVSSNGIGLKGGDTDQEIIVCGHIDTWNCAGAVDNGSGVAAMMELARLIAPYKLKRSVRFIAFGSEELGLHGSKNYIAARKDLSDIYCVLNLDCVAIREGSLGVATQENPAFHAVWERVERELNIDFYLTREATFHSDHHPFCERGVPAAALLSRGGGGFGYAHTAYDTLDKLDRRAFTLPLLITGVALIELAMSDIPELRA